MQVEKKVFDFVRNLVRERAAIVLGADKDYLLENRLATLIGSEGIASLEELVRLLQSKPFGDLHQKVIEAMTTNETSFFRDRHPFDLLKSDILPATIEARSSTRDICIWCAACSTGQEPYSIAMTVLENFPELNGWNVRVIATDISRDVLTRAKSGIFSQLEVNRGLPAPLLVKYFTKQGITWQIGESVKTLIQFRPINLSERWHGFPAADIVFIRNVLIYFDTATKRAILNRVCDQREVKDMYFSERVRPHSE